ncbi:MAG TPA: alpha-L-fucosidase [Polyangiaceae bacterium]|nr:alpha-L-fucosidase [Polyangiaceae bacterium]
MNPRSSWFCRAGRLAPRGLRALALLLAAGVSVGACSSWNVQSATRKGDTAARSDGNVPSRDEARLEALQRAYVELRFGMFIHFGILTYTGKWSEANLPIEQFNPTRFEPAQWADAAAAAGMKYGVLTTRHHDGFALWPSAAGRFNVKSVPWQGGQGDVVRAYVDAFRKRGLLPGLYYSVWDNTEGIGNGPVTPEQLTYVKTQLTELLSNYGPIPLLVFDGWSWKMGHKQVPYQAIRELVKSLQPDCLLLDHSHLMSPWDADIVAFEEPKDPVLAFSPPGNTFPASQGQKINGGGGNDWFWAPNIGGLMSVSAVVDQHLALLEPRFTNFLLNCPPNREGLLDEAIVTRLKEIGAAWRPNSNRPPLPTQGRQNVHPYTPVAATASSGNAESAIDGINDWGYYSVWASTGTLPQSLTLDLGEAKADVGFLGYVPRYEPNRGPSSNGAITSYRVLVSVDGATFTESAAGTWAADGKMKSIAFPPITARYVRLEALAAAGSSAVATEVTVGARR